MLLSLLTLLIGYKSINKTIKFSKPSETKVEDLSVMSYNLNQGYYMYEHKIDDKDFQKFIIEEDPDVLLLQEINSKYILNIIGELKQYKYRLLYDNLGTAILSKFSFIRKGKIDFKTITNSCVWADIKIGQDTARFYSIHLKSNQISKKLRKWWMKWKRNKKLNQKI